MEVFGRKRRFEKKRVNHTVCFIFHLAAWQDGGMKVVNGCWLRVEGGKQGINRRPRNRMPGRVDGNARPHPVPMASQARHESVAQKRRSLTRNVVPREKVDGFGRWKQFDTKLGGVHGRRPRNRMPGRRWYKADQRSCLNVTFVFFAGEKAGFGPDKTRLYRLVTDKPTSRLANAMIWFEFSRVRETEKRGGWRERRRTSELKMTWVLAGEPNRAAPGLL